MTNKVMKEYIDELNSKEANYDAILSRMKGDGNMKKSYKRKLLNISAILLILILLGTTSTQIYAKIKWNIEFKEYQNREYEVGLGAVKDDEEDGYIQKVEGEYITQDGISAKVDSLMITDDYLEAKVNFKFADNVQVDSKNFSFGYAIYDDEKNIYGISKRMHVKSSKYDKYTTYIYKELGVEYNKKDIYSIQLNDTSNNGNLSAKDRSITSRIRMTSTKGFPKSKKLYIQLFDLGYTMFKLGEENGVRKVAQAEDFNISDSEWIFEIDVPEKFYERETTQLKLKEDIPGLEIEKITISEIGLVVVGKLDGSTETIMNGKNMKTEQWVQVQDKIVNITDGSGKVYNAQTFGTTSVENGFKAHYPVNKKMLSKRLFINVTINGNEYTSELVE